MEQRPVLESRDPVEPVVQVGERLRVCRHRLRLREAVRRHRGAVYQLEDEGVRAHLVHLWYRVAVAAHVLHHAALALRIPTCLEAPEDAAVTEIQDLGGAALGDQLHALGSRRSTYFASTSTSRL